MLLVVFFDLDFRDFQSLSGVSIPPLTAFTDGDGLDAGTFDAEPRNLGAVVTCMGASDVSKSAPERRGFTNAAN